MAARLIWLPEPTAPPEGRNSTRKSRPFDGYAMWPCCSSVTSGVFSQIPGSVGDPSDAIVVPSTALDAGAAGASAAARSSAVVVSNCSTVRALAGGGGGGVGSNVGAGTAAGAVDDNMLGNMGDAHADSAINGIRTQIFIPR